MKDKKSIRRLCALLAALALLSSCARTETPPSDGTPSDTVGTEIGTESEDTGVSKTPNLEPVEPLFKNFFAFSGVGKYRELSAATRLKGECVSATRDGALLVFREAKIDSANRVSETFTVYRQETGSSVLSVSHSYRYGSYTEFDFDNLSIKDPAVNYPEQVMRVRVNTYEGESGEVLLRWIEVARAKVSPIESDAPEADRYEIRTTYEYYDEGGELIVSSAQPVSVTQNGAESGCSFRFGSVNALFEGETGELLSVSGADAEVIRYGYTHKTDRYGYYLDGRAPSALGREVRFLEVYRLSDNERILRYYPDSCDLLGTFVMGNGDILLQLRSEVSAESGIAYDYRDGDRLYTLSSYLLDVETGERTKTECPYILECMLSREELNDRYALSGQGIALTENAVNLFLARSIVDGVAGVTRLTVLNHDASLMYAMDRLVPEHRITEEDPFGLLPLSDGSYLVSLDSSVAKRAIVAADGRIRAYLGDDSARVVGGCVVMADGLYDYDLNRLYSFEAEGYTLFATVGEKVLLRGVDPKGEDETDMAIFEVVKQDGDYTVKTLFEGRDMELCEEAADYLLLRDPENGKYTMVNVKLAHLLTTESEMAVLPFEERYLVVTRLTDESGELVTLFYTVG